jgi:SGNH hydrolase-like domain, acetyltransferase AlgX
MRADSRWRLLRFGAGVLAVVACATGRPAFPWRPPGPAAVATRADVETVNPGYQRERSQLLVRRVRRPSRASLDYAAYHANFMNADPPPERDDDAGKRPDASHPFQGAIAPETLTASIGGTPLSAEERAHPVALAPLVELLSAKHVAGADRLEDVTGRVRAETWGLPGGPQVVRQTASEAYLHDPGAGRPVEIWVRIEFAPWFHAFAALPDEDGDGFPELYGRADASALGDPGAIARFIRDEYEGRLLSPAEVAGWAHQLASYWYPSYNTDLVDARQGWPAADTEPDIRKEAGSLHVDPAKDGQVIVMRGKPAGKAVYNVFLVGGPEAGAAQAKAGTAGAAFPKLPASTPTPDPAPVARAVGAELTAHGGSWAAWSKEVAPLHAALQHRLATLPAGAKALSGGSGFLFYGRSLSYVLGGDLGKQHGNKNPIPAIVHFRDLLAKHGVDLLFVPVPTKAEIFPERAATAPGGDAAPFTGAVGQVVNPFERKFLLELADKGVETVDLMPAFLAERARDPSPKGEALYQAQDTHWTSRGLQLAARLVAERVRRYAWYKPLAAHPRSYHTQDAPFTRHGDLVSRLPEAEQSKYAPETLVGQQVVGADGTPYDDDPESPIVLLGDSFTGVYQLMDCEHAGVSAHLAKELGAPLDLVMSYGGGPNVRSKLLRRGEADLGKKKLVIWMMTARDLYDFSEGWER